MHVNAEERETLNLGLAQGRSLRARARVLRQAPSTVSRELIRPSPSATATAETCGPLAVASGEDTSGWAARPNRLPGVSDAYPDDMRKHLSAETIDVALYVLPRGALRSELLAALRQARRPQARGTDRRGQIPHMTPMAERPAEVATRTMPGHWEGDLIKGARNGSAVGTLVERTTRLVLLARMEGTDARRAREGFTKKLRHVPALLRKTLTYDRRKEMAEHEPWAQRLTIRIVFVDPHSPWQPGTHKHTNGLLRQYLPKSTDLSGYTQHELNAIAHRLNTRPRTGRTSPRPWKSLRKPTSSFTRCTWNLETALSSVSGGD